MATFLEQLRQARIDSAIAYHLFLLKYPKPGVYAFYEGESDSSFYSPAIRAHIPYDTELHTFDCNGKRGVLDTYEKVSKKVTTSPADNHVRTLFFVDRDYSEFLDEPSIEVQNIFVTRFYSIENYLVSDSMLQVIFEDLFNFQHVDVEFETIREKFLEELNQFYLLMLPITAWILHLKRSGENIDLGAIKLHKLIGFDADLCIRYEKPTIADVLRMIDDMLGIEIVENAEEQCEIIVSELRGLDPKCALRGKFELWFFVTFVRKLTKSLKAEVLSEQQNLKTRLDLGMNNAVHILGPRVTPPEELNEFLITNLN